MMLSEPESFDPNNPNAGNERNFVEFYRRPIQNPEKTKTEGRPIYDMVEYVRIMVPGDKSNVVDREVRVTDKQNYIRQYQAFKAETSQDEASGTVLSAWGGIRPERVEEYAYFKVRTVEQLASLSDSNLQNLGPGSLADRQKAKDYVELMKGNAPVLQLRDENDKLKAKLAFLEQAVEALQRNQNAAANEPMAIEKKQPKTK